MKFKIGDKVKVVKCNIHRHCDNIGKIGEIESIIPKNIYPYKLKECDEWFFENELELVEENKTLGDMLGRTIDTILKTIKDNPEIAFAELNKKIVEKDEEIQNLKKLNKNQELQIMFLKGQLLVYENFGKEDVKNWQA